MIRRFDRSGFAGLALASALIACALPQGAGAQSLPGPAQPAPPTDRIQPPPPRTEVPTLDIQPLPGGRAPVGSETVTITINALDIEGATVIPQDELLALAAPDLGRPVPLSTLFDIAERMQAEFGRRGWVLTRAIVPPQEVADGRFRIRIVEGYVSDVIVQGEVGPVRALIDRYLDNLRRGGPTRADDLERYMLLVNDIPGITAQGTLRPGAENDGSSQLLVTVERDAFDGFASIDNRGSRFTGPWGGVVSGGANSFTALGERIEGTGFSTFEAGEQVFGQIAGEVRLGSEGTWLRAFASYAPAEPGYTLSVLDVETEARTAGVHVWHPFVRSRRFNVNAGAGFEILDDSVDAFSGEISRDHLRMIRLRADASYQDDWRGLSTLAVGAHFGLSGLGASRRGALDLSRAQGESDAAKFTAEATRLQHLFTWQGTSTNLFVATTGQWTARPLLSREEFTLGGARWGRGYAPSELTGDMGVATMAEVQFNNGTEFTFDERDWSLQYQVYGFHDFGMVWNRDVGSPSRQSLASAGGGLRFFLDDWLSTEFEVAKPLTKQPGSRNDGKSTPGYYVRVTTSF